MRHVSVSTAFDYGIPVHEQIPMIASAGFSHVSLGQNTSHCDYRSDSTKQVLKRILADHALAIDTIHGPSADAPNALRDLGAAADAAAYLGAEVVVLHPCSFEIRDDQLNDRLQRLVAMLPELDRVSLGTGVAFALENVMPGSATSLLTLALAEFNSRHIGFCYDSSHDQIGGPKPFDLLEQMKDTLLAVHLSDRVREFVDHVLPWDGFIDWDSLCPILKSAEITFPLLLEVMTTHSAVKKPTEFLRLAFERGCKLHDRIYS